MGITYYVAVTGDDTGDCLTPATSCRTIGAAVAKADWGDAIQIGPGVWVENLDINTYLEMRGAGTNQTVIDGGGVGPVIRDISSLKDLTIRNGLGGGVVVAGSVERVLVTGNSGPGIHTVFPLRSPRDDYLDLLPLGGLDEPGILGDKSRPLVLYQLVRPGNDLYLRKSAGELRLEYGLGFR